MDKLVVGNVYVLNYDNDSNKFTVTAIEEDDGIIYYHGLFEDGKVFIIDNSYFKYITRIAHNNKPVSVLRSRFSDFINNEDIRKKLIN